jgi:putative DNA primase/helicase
MKVQIKPLVDATTNGSSSEHQANGKDNNQMSNTTFSDHNQLTNFQKINIESQKETINLNYLKEALKDTALRNQLINKPLTDAGNAECFELLNQQHLLYCKTRKKWLMWRNNRWEVVTDGIAHRAAIETIRLRGEAANFCSNKELKGKVENWAKQSESLARRNAMLNTAMHLKTIETSIDRFDLNPYLAGVKNGTLDLQTGTFRESNREDYISMQFNVFYDPNAKAPRWIQFLEEIFDGDKELIAYIQKAVGYSITGDTSEQVLFLCCGDGANGKSVFLSVLSYLLGEHADNCSFSTFEANKRNETANDLAALKGKRLVTVIETDEDKRLAEARVKSVTGGDLITCRFLFGEFFSYRPQFKIWMAMNHKPLIKGTDRGIWRRIKLILFNQNFEDRQNPYLIEELKTELSGILNWALEGLMLWRKERLGTAKAIEEATNEYKSESDLVQQWIDECVELIPDFNTPCIDAHNSFVEWCKYRGYPFFSFNSFSRAMTKKGFERRNNGRCREYIGLALTASSH